MSNASLRHVVTSIVRGVASGQPAGQAALTVSKELVPHKYETVQPTPTNGVSAELSNALYDIQRAIDDATKSARSLPHLGGVVAPDVVFPAFTPIILTHGLGCEVAWQPMAVRPTNGFLRIASVQALNGKIQVTTQKTNTIAAGDTHVINGVVGITGVNQAWVVLAAQDDKNFTLAGSSFAGAYVSGGAVYCPGWDLYEGAQDVTTGRLTLVSTVPLTCDVHVYPKSAAVRS